MVVVGKIVKTHGIKGYLKVISYTDNKNRFNQNNKVFIEIDSVFKDFLIENFSIKNRFVFLKLDKVDSIDIAQNLLNKYIFIEEKDLMILEKDEYFIHDLIGLDVIDSDKNNLGKIIDVYQLPSNDIYEGETITGKKFLIPAVKDFISEINIEKRFIQLKTTEGILD